MMGREAAEETIEDPDTGVRSPQRKAARSGEETDPSNAAILRAVTSGFSNTNQQLSAIGVTLKAHDDRLTALEGRIDKLEQAPGLERNGAGQSRGTATTMAVLGGFRRDTRKKAVEQFVQTKFPGLFSKGAFCPGPRNSVCLVPGMTFQDIHEWRDEVEKFSVDGRKLWIAPSRPPAERAMRRKVGEYMRLLKPYCEDATFDIDADFKKGVVWVQDTRVVELEKDKWHVRETAIQEIFGETAAALLPRLLEVN